MTDDLRPPYRIQFDNARDPYTARNALGIIGTGGSGGGAPIDAEYIVAVDDPTLTNDRVLTNTATVTWDLTTPGQVKANAIGAAPLDALAYNGLQFNGSMEVSQENGASAVSVNNANKFIVDGWQLFSQGTTQTVAGQQAGPAFGPFASYLRMGVSVANPSPATSDAVVLMHTIEGYRASRLAMGTASAQSVSIGFWVYSAARAGTLACALRNGVGNRCYAFSVTISSAATWEYKTVTIPGDTTGTWAIDNTKALNLMITPFVGSAFSTAAGVWTAGNFYGPPGGTNFIQSTGDVIAITGVVILPGTQAPTAAQSGLIMRPFDQELMICKRYYSMDFLYGTGWRRVSMPNGSLAVPVKWPIEMRAVPTIGPIIDGAARGDEAEYAINTSGGASYGSYFSGNTFDQTTTGAHVGLYNPSGIGNTPNVPMYVAMKLVLDARL